MTQKTLLGLAMRLRTVTLQPYQHFIAKLPNIINLRREAFPLLCLGALFAVGFAF